MSIDIQDVLNTIQSARDADRGVDLEAVVAEKYAAEQAATSGDPFLVAHLNVATDTTQPGSITSALDPLTGWFPGHDPDDTPTPADLDSVLALGDVDRKTLAVLTSWASANLGDDLVGVALDAAEAAERGFDYVFDGLPGLSADTGLPLGELDGLTPTEAAERVLANGSVTDDDWDAEDAQ